MRPVGSEPLRLVHAEPDGPPQARPGARLVERFDDAAASLALRARRVPVLDRTMYLLSSCGDDGRLWFGAAAIEAARVRSPRRFLILVGWLGVESAVVNLGIKKVARRPRPDVITEHEHRLRIPTDTSFPSGHAASSALMAVLLSEDSPLAPLWIALAAGVGASRVHVGVHHGSDVLAGWGVGATFGVLARRLGASAAITRGGEGDVVAPPTPRSPAAGRRHRRPR